jgi:choline dehydrogenase-like flavoprotein
MFDVVIAGSGPAAAAALSGLDKKYKVLVVEPSVESDSPESGEQVQSLTEALGGGFVQSILGKNFEYLRSLRRPWLTHPKLRSRSTGSVTLNGRTAEVFDSTGVKLTEVRSSNKEGGLSAVWGAQLYRYSNDEITDAGSWPISLADIETDYNSIEETIAALGYELSVSSAELEHVLADNSKLLLRRAGDKGSSLSVEPSRNGIKVRTSTGDASSAMCNLDFFRLHDGSVFTATRLMESASADRIVEFRRGLRVVGWKETEGGVNVFCEDESGLPVTLQSRKLILACGTLETTALVLENQGGEGVKLPFLDHPPFLLPVVSPETVRSSPPAAFPSLQLSVRVKGANQDLTGTFYSPLGMLFSDLAANFPLDLRLASKAVPAIIPMLGVVQAWPVSRDASKNSFEIDSAGKIKICFATTPTPPSLRSLTKALRSAGFITFSKFVKPPVPGWGFHYVGTLPMSLEPSQYQTHIDGRLWNSQNVLVVDGSVIPSLPALNHSLTLMANSRRIARGLKLC